jgi:hypothetical protein
MDRGQTIG